MKLREMIETLRVHQRVQIRNRDGYEICICKTDSEGIMPYMDNVVSEWFIGCPPFAQGVDFVVYVEMQEKKENENDSE